MNIIITQRQAQRIGYEKFSEWGFSAHTWRWGDSKGSIALRDLSLDSIERLKQLFQANESVYGVKAHVNDLGLWQDAITSEVGGGNVVIDSIKVLAPLLDNYVNKIPGRHVFKKHEEADLGGDDDLSVKSLHCYYVGDIVFHPEVKHKKTKWSEAYTDPAYVTCVLGYETIDGKATEKLTWHAAGKTAIEMFTDMGYIPATEKLRDAYRKRTERFLNMIKSIGKQYIASGDAWNITEDMNTNVGKWWLPSATVVELAKNTRVVIDIINENETDEDNHKFFGKHHEDAELSDTDDEDAKPSEPIEIPIHHYLVVFSLAKHLRLKIHMSQLHKYKYDTKLINKLVIDDTRKRLIKLLIQHRDSKYEDIIGGKSGGAIVMLCGSPGTGKTLTAEVFAESEKRALYSVQCAQLGITPETLETSLLKVLARAARWNAVLLLDEADVYIHRRGSDIRQNAMVGVFLRVLEYQNTIMFMTTNRAEDIDDAVASRCTARLTYTNPSFEEQCKIWRVLVDAADAKMSDKAIARIARDNSTLSGRDVKNLIKLAVLVSDEEFTVETIDFVKQFKPT